MKKEKWFYGLKLSCLFLLLISVVITFTINFIPLYKWSIRYYELDQIVGLSEQTIVKNYYQLLAFLNLPWISPLNLADFPVSTEGAQHFSDVKRLFLLNYVVLLLTILPSCFFLVNLWKKSQFWRLIRPFQIAAIFPLFLSFLMFLGFDQFFTGFHRLFFSNDNWIFSPITDPIILVLPQEFFFYCFLLAIVLFESVCLIVILFGKKNLKKYN